MEITINTPRIKNSFLLQRLVLHQKHYGLVMK